MNLLDQWIKLLSPFGFSLRYVKWSFITTISALLENRCYMLDNGGGFIYPTLYTLLVGAPATYKTTTCDRAVVDLLHPIITEADGPFIGPTIASPAGLIRAFDRHNKANVANEYQSSPMFIYAPEWQQFYCDIGGGELIRDLLSYYDPKPPGWVMTKEIVKDSSPRKIISPGLTILGCATVKAISDSKMMTFASNGIVSRFIFVHEPSRPKGHTGFMSIKAHPEMIGLRIACQQIRAMKGEFKLSVDASEALGVFVEANNRWNQENPAETLYSHYMARRSTQLKKLSMIISAFSRNSMVIEHGDVMLADALLRDIEPDMPQAFGIQILAQDTSLMTKIHTRIPATGITEAQLLNLFILDGQILPDNLEYNDCIRGLIKLQWIVRYETPEGDVVFKNTGKKAL